MDVSDPGVRESTARRAAARLFASSIITCSGNTVDAVESKRTTPSWSMPARSKEMNRSAALCSASILVTLPAGWAIDPDASSTSTAATGPGVIPTPRTRIVESGATSELVVSVTDPKSYRGEDGV